MANKAIGSASATVLPDEVKARFSGSINYTPGTGEYWYYKQMTVPNSAADVILTTDEFFGNSHSATDTIAATDLVKWIAIKHTGTSNGTTTTTDAIMLNHTAGVPVYNGTDGTSNILIYPNEILVCKLNGVETQDLHMGTCAMSGQSPASGGGTVYAYVAAIIKDV